MLFVVLCLDRPDALPRRMAVIDAHRAYLADNAHPVRMLMSGPLVRDDEPSAMKGSFFLLDAPDRAAVAAWQADDPLAAAGVWESVTVEAFHKRVDRLSAGAA